jgi:hypothetical protein
LGAPADSFFILCVLVTITAAPSIYLMGLMFMLYGPILFGTILCHEVRGWQGPDLSFGTNPT